MPRLFTSLLFIGFALSPLAAQAAAQVYMEDMTWMEIRDRIEAGTDTVIIPTGGTEQNGPAMVTGKHNVIVRYTSGEIARHLGNTLVAPVLAYVPEGRLNPPEGHLQFPGTVGLTEETFSHLLEDAATSYKQNGFKLICFVGDHGGSQPVQQQIADKLTSEWQSTGVRVLNVSDYYAKNGQDKWVQSIGIKIPNPSSHAGLEDTSELMALDAGGVRSNLRGPYTDHDYFKTGAMGDSTQASADYGRKLLSLKVDAAVKQINNALRHSEE